MRVILVSLGLVVLVWVVLRASDRWYARRIERQQQAWSETIERDAEGIRAGFAPWSLGEGGTALLFIPGFAGAPSLYQRMAPALAERGYACRAMRLPGFGDPFDRAATVTAADWLEAVERELDGLRAEHDEVWLVGHSLGAALALQVVQSDPDRAAGVVLLAPLIEVSGRRSPVLPPARWYAIGRRLFKSTAMLESNFPLDLQDESAGPLVQRDRFIPINLYHAVFDTLDGLPRPEDFALPVLMMVAPGDAIADPAAAQAWFERLPVAHRHLQVETDAGHVLPLDTGWDRRVQEIDDFIRSAP